MKSNLTRGLWPDVSQSVEPAWHHFVSKQLFSVKVDSTINIIQSNCGQYFLESWSIVFLPGLLSVMIRVRDPFIYIWCNQSISHGIRIFSGSISAAVQITLKSCKICFLVSQSFFFRIIDILEVLLQPNPIFQAANLKVILGTSKIKADEKIDTTRKNLPLFLQAIKLLRNLNKTQIDTSYFLLLK